MVGQLCLWGARKSRILTVKSWYLFEMALKRAVYLIDSPGYGQSVAACVSWTRGLLCTSRGGSWGSTLKSPWVGNCDHLTTTAEGSSKLFCESLSLQQPRKTLSVGSCLNCHMLEFKQSFLPWQRRTEASLWFGASREHRCSPSCPNLSGSWTGWWWAVPPAVATAMVLLSWAAPPHMWRAAENVPRGSKGRSDCYQEGQVSPMPFEASEAWEWAGLKYCVPRAGTRQKSGGGYGNNNNSDNQNRWDWA